MSRSRTKRSAYGESRTSNYWISSLTLYHLAYLYNCHTLRYILENPIIIVFMCIGESMRGSCMNAHVLMNLLNELGKRDKMRGLPNIFFSFKQRV